ncbi:MAG: DEAD/DEAH box helicase [Verrucomicrobiae bacterium]|nr:DEAD/DEAH box helicase [Verrucomicrobiae bacterium]
MNTSPLNLHPHSAEGSTERKLPATTHGKPRVHAEASPKAPAAPHHRPHATRHDSPLAPDVAATENPSGIPLPESGVTFASLALIDPIQKALKAKNYTVASPIQAQSIPPLLEGRDLLGCAQTGTGKTAAFALPILQKLSRHARNAAPMTPRALILSPTRELALQIGKSFADYGKFLHLRTACVFGGVSQFHQVRDLRRGVDILVATPGRLMDLMEQGFIRLEGVEILVLDEADRMLDMGFIHDIRRISEELPEKRQSLFFSATLSREITELANTLLSDPVRVNITPQVPTAEKIDQRICFVEHGNKFKLLQELLTTHGHGLTLIFARTKHGANRLSEQLDKAGTRSSAIHGNKTQAARERALEGFRTHRYRVLVATDVAARGIDVKGITLVVNYDLPDEPESYVHRIGRTARAGAEGLAISFCCADEVDNLRSVQRLIKKTIPVFTEHSHHNEDIAQRALRNQSGGGGGGGRPNFRSKFRGRSGGGGGNGGGKFGPGGRRFGGGGGKPKKRW